MLRTALLLAGLGAALTIGGLAAVRSQAVASSGGTSWVVQQAEDVIPGHVYRLEGCLTITGPGVEFASVRLSWHEDPAPYGGPSIFQEDAPADPSLIGVEQCLTLASSAFCTARSARYGVVAKGDTSSASVSSLEFSLQDEATPIPCPTPTATSTADATSTPTPTPHPAPTPTTNPPDEVETSAPTQAPDVAEPLAFPALVNGGFEELREDGTPFGWHKIGGEMSATTSVRAEGQRSAALTSDTDSTKWLHQTVSVEGGAYYRLQAAALKGDPGAREVLLRIAWYESEDASGSQIGTAESPALAESSRAFAALDTGPALAPAEARSAKVRLLMRPASAAPATVYFDNVRFEMTEPPPPAPETTASTSQPASGGGRSSATSGSPEAEARPEPSVLSAWAGPTPLANVRSHAPSEAQPEPGDGRPFWPLLLALGVPVAALATAGGYGWWSSRGAGREGDS